MAAWKKGVKSEGLPGNDRASILLKLADSDVIAYIGRLQKRNELVTEEGSKERVRNQIMYIPSVAQHQRVEN